MAPSRILLTGASGCIGHYLAEALIAQTNCELLLLVRDPAKLQLDCQARPGIRVLQGDLREIERWAPTLATVEVAILAATAWGGEVAFEINVTQTLRLLALLDPAVCQQVFYFSTASLLDYHHRLLPETARWGTEYIRSKYACHQRLSESPWADRITVLFPTLVFGGDARKPRSYLTAGVADAAPWVALARWLRVEGSFHFIHARDIAQIVCQLLAQPPAAPGPRELVLGTPAVTANEAIATFCRYLGKRIYLRLPLPGWLIRLLVAVLPVQLSPWDRFCLRRRHFSHRNPTDPSHFGLRPYCPTLFEALRLSGVPTQAPGR